MTQTDKPIWQPAPKQIEQANLSRFMGEIYKRHGQNLKTYDDLHKWSIANMRDFWCAVWDFCDLITTQKGKREIDWPNGIFKTEFFKDAELNFAENLLRHRDPNTTAIMFWGEDKVKRSLTYKELYQQTTQLAAYLKSIGVQKGDRVAGYVPNTPEAVIAMLATTSLGAIWSSCSPDFGVSGLLDRFTQIEPKVLIMADGYYYNGKTFSCLDKSDDLQKGLPSLNKTIVFPYINLPKQPGVLYWEEALQPFNNIDKIDFIPVPFNHPVYIMYSSGTTGIPKCILHGVGGTLLQHMKEHQLHCDIKPGDRLFYFTTCGWMMWNWQVSALASNATLCLYDGSPIGTILWEYAESAKITHFGTSAKYLDAMAKAEIYPRRNYDLSSLKMITSTGSPLVPESFDYVYEHIAPDVHLASISGGTDILSCFLLGNPIGPVWRGELQVPGLGMDVQVFDENGNSVTREKGELVCKNPFPCMPVSFWGDKDDVKYHTAYFEKFPNVWCHGDYVEHTVHNGFIIYGRSDTVLNPGGVRIGTAEIYRQVEQMPEILESLVIGQDWKGDVRVILFVILRDGITLTSELIDKIKRQIRNQTTPRHVPSKVISVTDIPRTKSGKIVELAVREVIHRRPVKNSSSLANPEALLLFEGIEELGED